MSIWLEISSYAKKYRETVRFNIKGCKANQMQLEC
jgi:hypothetical protein